jgi:glycosyltransferase involved in cell wall biosynthesis
MLATGLPLIEFEDGSFNDFFDEDTAILTSYSSKSLFIKMKEAMDNPDILRKHNINAINCMKDLSWDKTCEQFYQIINGVGNAIVTIKN